VQEQLANLRAVSAASGIFPYACINHSEQECAFEAVQFVWRGHDPISGGIWLEVRWLDSGLEVLRLNRNVQLSPKIGIFTDEPIKRCLKLSPIVGSLCTETAARNLPIQKESLCNS